MRKTNKKGFTIVELVIVIAVIAVLAAVLIPTFTSLTRKANESKDIQLVRNLNTALAADTEEHNTMQSALDAAAAFGYDVDKINASATDNEVLWDSVNDVFCYLKGSELVYVPNTTLKETKVDSHNFWKIADKVPTEQVYSIYAGSNFDATEVKGLTVGFDAGNTTGITKVEYTGNKAVTIRTNSTDTAVVVDNKDATVNHYGISGIVDVKQVANLSYHLFGTAQLVNVTSGRVVIEAGANAAVHVSANTAKVEVAAQAKVSAVTKETGVTATVTGATATEATLESAMAAATEFAGGLGTKANPYLISNAAQIQNINKKYDSYNYYKVVDGVKQIDCTGWTRVDLNGSFDGNGVVLNGVDSVLFNNVGAGADSEAVVIENFTINFAGGDGVARVCATPNLTFRNIVATGYLIEDWNAAAFLRYGTNNYVKGGFSYTVNFENCASAAEIYATSNSYSTILVGHTYKGDDANTVTINVDAATNSAIDATTLYYSGAANTKKLGYKYYSGNAATVYVDGVATTNNKIEGDNVVHLDASKLPTKNDKGAWNIDTEADTAKVVVKLNWQYTLWTENYGEKIPDQSGVGGNIGDEIVIEVSKGETVNALPAFTSIEIKTGADKWNYEIVDGKLIIYMTTDNQYVDGWLTLCVEQYTNGKAIAKYTGNVRIAEKSTSSDWVIK